jgi:purine nucleosidase
MSRQKVVLDVDTGVDDALAIALALRSPELDILGITTVGGNVPLARTTANTLAVLDALRAPEIPVVTGAARPLVAAPLHADEVHGEDGLGGLAARLVPTRRTAARGAVDFLLEAIAGAPDEVVLIATGPLTNVAQAVLKDPDAMARLRGVTVMAGAVRVPGNVTAVAEFNVWADPEAAATVLAARLPLTLVPLDATERALLPRAAMDSATGPWAAFVRDLTRHAVAFHAREERVDGLFLHDPLAVATVAAPDLVRREDILLAVECGAGLTRGMLVADLRRRRRGGGISTCTTVDAPRFYRLFTERVLEGREGA